MIDCHDFKQWLGNFTEADAHVSGEARHHMQGCRSCSRLYEKDQLMEQALKNGMQAVAPPAGLVDRVRTRVVSRGSRSSKRNFVLSWKVAAPVFASILAVFLFLFNPFAPGLPTIDDVVAQSIAFHQNVDMRMEFASHDTADPAQWFRQRLDFAVRLPDMDRLGLTWKGGRKCRLGKVEAAYLSCQSTGKRASLFLINPDDIGFAIDEGREYLVRQNGTAVTVWKEAGVVLALVV